MVRGITVGSFSPILPKLAGDGCSLKLKEQGEIHTSYATLGFYGRAGNPELSTVLTDFRVSISL